MAVENFSFEQALAILKSFEENEVDYVLIGSIAMAAHGVVRATRDIDFFIKSDPQSVTNLRRALHQVFGEDSDIDLITAEDLNGKYPVLQYVPPSQQFAIDIIAKLGERVIENLESETVTIDGVNIRVATINSLIDMKKNSMRQQDQVDAQALARIISRKRVEDASE